MKARLRAWLGPKVRRQRARAIATDAAVADLDAGRISAREMLDRTADEIIAAHNALHHPGFGCAENERGQCVEAFGGTRASGWAGEYMRPT